jgi:hypothetical protein
MSEIVRCPECGGIVGATEATDDGPPCTCFGQPGFQADDDASSTKMVSAPSVQKICCMCGKDLAGHRRFKDSRGYWCPDCMKEDEKKSEATGTPCEQCGRKVPENSLTSVDGKRMCLRCVREQRELRAPGNKKFRTINDRTYKEHEKRNMVIMAVVAVILLILMFIAWQRRPWRESRGGGGETVQLATHNNVTSHNLTTHNVTIHKKAPIV